MKTNTKTSIINTISNPGNIKKVLIGTTAIVALVGIGAWGAVVRIANR